MNDFQAEPSELRASMINAVQRVFESGWYVLGQEVKTFEKKWADLCGVSHGIGVGNGMDAIEIILRSLGIGPGDEVITTPMTAFATVLAILRAGATPVLADIEPETALLSRESVYRCITKKTKAVVLVHLYGHVRNMDQWQKFCQDEKIELIEDCAQSHLASYQGGVAGAFGVAGAYSFYPTKNLGTAGDGGMVVTNDESLAERAMQIRNYGQSIRYYHPMIGMNSRLDEIHAAMLSARLSWLHEFTSRRIEIANIYRSQIKNQYVTQLAEPLELQSHVYHLYVIQSPRRDALMQHLQGHNIQSLIHYPVPIHQQEPCKEFRCDPEGLRFSEQHAKECLSIPCHPQMSNSDVEQVVISVNRFGSV